MCICEGPGTKIQPSLGVFSRASLSDSRAAIVKRLRRENNTQFITFRMKKHFDRYQYFCDLKCKIHQFMNMVASQNMQSSLFKAYNADSSASEGCPCCKNIERLLREQIRCVSVIVSTPFNQPFTSLIGPALSEVRLLGGELFSFSPQRRQSVEFASAVQKFDNAVEAYSNVVRTIEGLDEGRHNIPASDMQRALLLRRSLINIVRYAEVLAKEASTVDEEP